MEILEVVTVGNWRNYMKYISLLLLLLSPHVYAEFPKLTAKSHAIVNLDTNEVISKYKADKQLSIASITKLMNVVVFLDSEPNLEGSIVISNKDVDRLKGTSSKLPIGYMLSKRDALILSLTASENRAASAILRSHPKGKQEAIKLMNNKAQLLGMTKTKYVDGTGLSAKNVSSANDLIKLLKIISVNYPTISQYSVIPSYTLEVGKRNIEFRSTNHTIRNTPLGMSNILLSKTGYTNEARSCIVLITVNKGYIFGIVLLGEPKAVNRTKDLKIIQEYLDERIN